MALAQGTEPEYRVAVSVIRSHASELASRLSLNIWCLPVDQAWTLPIYSRETSRLGSRLEACNHSILPHVSTQRFGSTLADFLRISYPADVCSVLPPCTQGG